MPHLLENRDRDCSHEEEIRRSPKVYTLKLAYVWLVVTGMCGRVNG